MKRAYFWLTQLSVFCVLVALWPAIIFLTFIDRPSRKQMPAEWALTWGTTIVAAAFAVWVPLASGSADDLKARYAIGGLVTGFCAFVTIAYCCLDAWMHERAYQRRQKARRS
jgi:hypothetical protein